jgi:mannose-1-phosphate guanylyltransferase/mannose-6-phosphate isomerase
MPKQLMPLVSSRTMLQETTLRLNGSDRISAPVIISNEVHRFIIASQLQELGIRPLVHVLEPEGRNTAPAAAVASKIVSDVESQGIVLLLPADHHISDVEGFRQAVRTGAEEAETGHIVTFGVTPTSPETGYGYIQQGQSIGRVFAVTKFHEKPTAEKAKSFLAGGGCYWNSGIFMVRADVLADEMQLHCPSILARSTEALSGGHRDLDFLRLDATAFQSCPSEPFDTAVMEHTERAVVLPLDVGWSDVGSWTSLWDLGQKDASGNSIDGDVIAMDTANTYIRGDRRLITVLGIRNLIIVDSGDAIMIADKERVQEVRSIAAKLKELGRREYDVHARVHRPWGFYESIEIGDRYQVKHLMVKPGASLSLQMHHHRAEHWVVVRGTARVRVKEQVTLLTENESTYIPIGAPHRLENPGQVPLSIIEVQSGAYLGEDDIVRFEDSYGRE